MASKIKLTIYDLSGRRVRTLADGCQTAGYQSLDWDGNNDEGNEVASGIYFYRLEAETLPGMNHVVHTTETRKMLLLK
jgi:flagellar hook assembly protein FlgD